MIQNTKVSELKTGDVIHYNTRDCVRSTGANRGMFTYSAIKSITAASQSTVRVKTTVGDTLILPVTGVAQVEVNEGDYLPQPRTRSQMYRGVSIE